jgi:hypothetical protein
MPNANIQSGFSSVFPSGISSFGIVGPNASGDYLVVGNTTVPAIQATLNLLPLPNEGVVNQQFCDTISVTPGAAYFSYVPTAAERAGNFTAFATQLAGVPGVTEGQFSLEGAFWGWRIPAQLRTSTVVSEDPNFTPSVLASELSSPAGIVFRPQPGDLVVAQFGAELVSMISATTGATTAFANQNAPADVAVRASDGVVAVNSVPAGQVSGPINFFSSAGSLLGSIPESVVLTAATPFIPEGTTNVCIAGIAFDASGNLLVAAGPGTAVAGGCAPGNAWAVYQFPGPTPWTVPASQVSVVATALNQLAGLIFSAAPLPAGALYATSNTTGAIYQFLLGNGDAIIATTATIATVPTTINDSGNPVPDVAGIAQDPLVGYLYIAEFLGGNILRIPPGGGTTTTFTPTTFATGFSNTFGLSFDTDGNLYVTEYNTGKIWKFTRKSFATGQQPIIQGQTNSLTFVNPDPAQSDQRQTILIPASANFCDPSGRCAAFVRDVFVDVDAATLDATLAPGSGGDTGFFGGTSVPPGTTCVIVPSAQGCLAIVQQCFDASGKAFDICPVQEPFGSTDLIQLSTEYTAPSLPPNLAFLIAHDSLSDYTDITMGSSTDTTGSGGTKGLCSKTVLASLGPTTGQDFSLSPISPITLSLGGSTLDLDGKDENEHGTECETRKRGAAAIRGEHSRGDGDGCADDESRAPTVTVHSINGFTSTVNLGLSDVPTGASALFGITPTTSVTPPSNGSVSSALNVSLGPSVTPSMFTLIVAGNAPPSKFDHLTSMIVTVRASTSGVSTVIGDLLSSGCIDNAGFANALTSKLSAAQRAIGGDEIQTAINILTAFKNQVRAQTGKHIATSCTIGGITFNPADALLTDAQSLIDSLSTGLIVDR